MVHNCTATDFLDNFNFQCENVVETQVLLLKHHERLQDI